MLFQHFQQTKTPAVYYFCFFNIITPQPYLSPALFQYFQQYKTPGVPYFGILNRIKPQQYLIIAFSMEKNPPVSPYFCFSNNIRPQYYISSTLLQHFQKCKTQQYPFSIVNIRKLQPFLILAFSIKKISSSTLFQHLQRKKTPAAPYFCFLKNITPSRTLVVPYFRIFKYTRSQPYLIILNRLNLQSYFILVFSIE